MPTLVAHICTRSIHLQISPASSATPPGLEAVLRSFYVIVDDIKRRPYDLLDYAKNTFDRDYLEFNVNIHDLDSQMQVRGVQGGELGVARWGGGLGAFCPWSHETAAVGKCAAHKHRMQGAVMTLP